MNLLKKLTRAALPLTAAAVALFMAGGNASAQCLTCVNSFVVPSTPVTITANGQVPNTETIAASTGQSAFLVQLGAIGSPSNLVAGNVYKAWCAAWYSSPFDTSDPTGYDFYSTYGSMKPPVGNEPLTDAYTWNMINYILNNKQGTVKDVQDAIWLVMTGQTNNLPTPPTAAAQAMANAAITNGANYVPSYPGLMAVFISIGPDSLALTAADGATVAQSLFIEVPVPNTQPVHVRPTVTCPSNSASVGYAYSSTLVAAQGTPGYTFSLIGSYPPGLLLTQPTTTAPTIATLAGTPTVAGTYNFTAQVVDASGLSDNTGTAACTITVTGTGSVSKGDTATIGFWANKNGQYVISLLNGGCTSTALGNWLATNYPAFFSGLAGKDNTYVGKQFITYFTTNTTTKWQAQLMAVALATYTTNTSLSGTSTALVAARKKFYFNSSSTGTGAKTYNVGAYGAAIGFANYSTPTVSQILAKAQTMKAANTFDSTSFNAVLDGINQRGDIK